MAVAVFWIQYLFRQYDDNRFSSWNDVFEVSSFLRILVMLVCALPFIAVLTRSRRPERHGRIILFLAAAGISAFFWSEPEAILDAARYFSQAKYLFLYGPLHFVREWGREIAVWTDLPAVPFIYGSLFRVFGESRSVVQVFNSILFGASVLLTFSIACRLWDRTAGYVAGLFLMSAPYLFVQTPLMLVDMPEMFLLLISLRLYLAALDKGGWRLAAAGISIALFAYSKYSSLLFMPVFPAALFVVARGEGAGRKMRRGMAALAVAAVCIGCIWGLKQEVFVTQWRFLMEYQKPGLSRWGESLVSTLLFQMHPFVTFFALGSVAVAIRRRDPMLLIPAASILLMTALQVRRTRYLVPAFPMLSIMAAYAATRLFRRETAVSFAFSSAVSAVLVACFAFLPFLESLSSANIRDMGRYLDRSGLREAVVVFDREASAPADLCVVLPILDLYTKTRLTTHEPGSSAVPEGMRSSALRFTWEFGMPRFYLSSDDGMVPLLVVSGKTRAEQGGPCENRGTPAASFVKEDPFYQFRTSAFLCAPNVR